MTGSPASPGRGIGPRNPTIPRATLALFPLGDSAQQAAPYAGAVARRPFTIQCHVTTAVAMITGGITVKFNAL